MHVTVAALRMNVTLQELFLADNQLLISDALQLGNLLRCNSTIHLLDIRNNLIQVSARARLSVLLTRQEEQRVSLSHVLAGKKVYLRCFFI